MKIFFNVILIIIFLVGIFYISAEAGYFKNFAIIVDNTDAPTGIGTIKAVNVNTSEEFVFTIENGSSVNVSLPEGTYNIFGCVYPETAALYDVIVSGDLDVKLEYSPGFCPF